MAKYALAYHEKAMQINAVLEIANEPFSKMIRVT
jgi:hypothetical protein